MRTMFVISVCLLACGGGQDVVDASSPDAGGEAAAADAGRDVGADSNQASDAPFDANDGAVQSPALWSKGFANTTFRGLHRDTLLLVDYTAGADIGTGPLSGSGCVGVVIGDGDGFLVRTRLS